MGLPRYSKKRVQNSVWKVTSRFDLAKVMTMLNFTASQHRHLVFQWLTSGFLIQLRRLKRPLNRASIRFAASRVICTVRVAQLTIFNWRCQALGC